LQLSKFKEHMMHREIRAQKRKGVTKIKFC